MTHSRATTQHRTVLVVENNLPIRQALTTILTGMGWQVRTTGTTAEALAALEPPPSRLILDLMLPDGSGVEVLRHARVNSLRTRILVISGTEDHHLLEEARRLRPDALWQKPVLIRQVLDWLTSVSAATGLCAT